MTDQPAAVPQPGTPIEQVLPKPLPLGELMRFTEEWAKQVTLENWPYLVMSTAKGVHMIALALPPQPGVSPHEMALRGARLFVSLNNPNAAVWACETYFTQLNQEQIRTLTKGTMYYGDLPESLRHEDLILYGNDELGFEQAHCWRITGKRPNRTYDLLADRGMQAAQAMGVRPLIPVAQARPRP